jgi:hypothetical protein
MINCGRNFSTVLFHFKAHETHKRVSGGGGGGGGGGGSFLVIF